MKINLTKLLEVDVMVRKEWLDNHTSSQFRLSEDRTSPDRAYSFYLPEPPPLDGP